MGWQPHPESAAEPTWGRLQKTILLRKGCTELQFMPRISLFNASKHLFILDL
jgi:hypothetical protein